MKLTEIAKLFNVSINNDCELTGINTDTRKIFPGQLFVAIVGEQFDGHDFVTQAAEKGAVAAIVSKDIKANIPVIKVSDTIEALAKMASYHRQQFDIPMVALTGSCGKTTVKEMIASILKEHYTVFASPGNFNNHIGVPLSLLKLEKTHQAAVFELGANHPGEIAYTAGLVKPTVALITNVGPAHLLGFGSIEGVMRAKSEIYKALSPQGTAIYNADDDFAPVWQKQLADRKTLSFGIKNSADIRAENISYDDLAHPSFDLVTPAGKFSIKLQANGGHNVLNALAATAAGLAMQVPLEKIKQGLEKFTAVAGRMVLKSGLKGATIIDDSYNANLKSVIAALEMLAKLPGNRILVLGDMGELGDSANEHHRLIGEKARQLGIDNLFTCGKLSRLTSEAFAGTHHYSDQASLIEKLIPVLNDNTAVVVKGSRSAHMEHVVAALTASA